MAFCSSKTLTSNTGEKLPRKALYLTVREWNKRVALEEVKDTLSEQIHDDAYMTSIVKTVTEVYTPVSILMVVGL